MKANVVIANPAGNITAFVLDDVAQEAYISVSQKIMAVEALGVEQVGFVKPPKNGGLLRLEMMGGEFCGNATRSMGMLAAKQRGMQGRCTIGIECSGAQEVLPVFVDMDAGETETVMPKPVRVEKMETEQAGPLTLVFFEGVLHVIAPDLACNEQNFHLVRASLPAGCDYDALGVMFYDTKSDSMQPAVYVKGPDSLVFESSCGSGTVAAAVWRSLDLRDGKAVYEIRQPGGLLRATVDKADGAVTQLLMGGPVVLQPKQILEI